MSKGKVPTPIGRDAALKGLKELLREKPSGPDLTTFLSEALHREKTANRDYRGETLTAVALLDEALRVALESRFVPLNSERRKELFSDAANGSLSTFSNKIRMGYALGLYGDKFRGDLDIVRQIRNVFAHASRHVDFETAAVSQVCGLLHYSHVLVGSEMIPDDYVKDPARCFFAVCSLAGIYFVRLMPNVAVPELTHRGGGPEKWRLT